MRLLKNIVRQIISFAIDVKTNPYHPLVLISGNPEIGSGTYIGAFSEINARGAKVIIGERCDIASFVAINCADSHLMTIGKSDVNVRDDIRIGEYVFIGSHSAILGGAVIGHHSVVAAGTIVRKGTIEPYSLVMGNPMTVKPGYYASVSTAAHETDPH